MRCCICNISTTNKFIPIADGNLIYRGSNRLERVLCKDCEHLWISCKVIIPETDDERKEAKQSIKDLVKKRIDGIQGRNNEKEEY